MDVGGQPIQIFHVAVATSTDPLVVLVVGPFAGAHCLGVCGRLASFYIGRVSEDSESQREDPLTLFATRKRLPFTFELTPGYAVVDALFGVLSCVVCPSVAVAVPVSDVGRDGLSSSVFGPGTVPTLLAFGTLLGMLSRKRRISLQRGLGAAFLLPGDSTPSHRCMLRWFDIPHLTVPNDQPLA